ncbi:MAG TPA: HAD hydrolase-like protein [Stellaceae bacterium]|nr:HAD hydrolase-like protein [Stellaceae bacterium]
MFKLLSFDVYGTLMETPSVAAKAFRAILADAGAANIDPAAFAGFWEERNIAHYYEPYRSYKEIGRQSLDDAFRHFGIAEGNPDLIRHYFDAFAELRPYPDVEPILEKLARTHRIALVSNIDDDLLAATPVPAADLICTAERARGYKPDGTLFRYLIANAGVAVPEILHSGQSQHTDMVGGKPLGLTVAWINRRNLSLHPSVPKPDHVYPDLRPLVPLVGG